MSDVHAGVDDGDDDVRLPVETDHASGTSMSA